MVIRTQKDKKLQTLIEVCTDFASLSHTTNVHRPAEQVFALEEDDDREEEMFAVVDSQQWNTQRAAEPPLSPELQQMFALARRMGYDASTLLDGRLVLNHPRIKNIAHHFDHATIPGLNVSAVVSWDTHKFVVPNRTHLFRSDRVDGLTGRMDHSDAMEDLHRETRYRLGPNPHWPACHRFGPRFIIICHPSYSSGQFIYLHTPWGFNL